MRRRAMMILTLLSTTLCVAVVILWIRSYWASDCIWFQHTNGRRENLLLARGNVSIFQTDYYVQAPPWKYGRTSGAPSVGVPNSRFSPATVHSFGGFLFARLDPKLEPTAQERKEYAETGRAYAEMYVQSQKTAREIDETYRNTPTPRMRELSELIRSHEREIQQLLDRAAALLDELKSRFVLRWAIGLPMWVLVLLTGLLPAIHLRRTLRTRRYRKTGRCVVCGYDLRGTPDRCPECGTTAPEKLSAVQSAVGHP
jgi:hypothetical protein